MRLKTPLKAGFRSLSSSFLSHLSIIKLSSSFTEGVTGKEMAVCSCFDYQRDQKPSCILKVSQH